MSFPPGHLVEHPPPPGIMGALELNGYQLLVEVAGVGAARLGSHAFLVIAPDVDPASTNAGTQVALHQSRLRDEAEANAFVQLAAQLGVLRLSGYRLVLERNGLRSKVSLVNPATGAVALAIPDRHPGRLFGGGSDVGRMLALARSLAPAGPAPDLQNPEVLRPVLLALALGDPTVGGAEAAELADRAVSLARADPRLDPPAALQAARQQG